VDRFDLPYLGDAHRWRHLSSRHRSSALPNKTATGGARNDIDELGLRHLFAGWQIDALTASEVTSDTPQMPDLFARLVRP